MVIDGEMVITGSFNFTKAAEENNTENLLVIHDRKLASLYIKNWQEHAQHSEVYRQGGELIADFFRSIESRLASIEYRLSRLEGDHRGHQKD